MSVINGKLRRNEDLGRRLADRRTRLNVAVAHNQSKAVQLAADHEEDELEVNPPPFHPFPSPSPHVPLGS